MKKKHIYFLVVPILALLLWGAVGTTIDDFFIPGSQPGQSGNLESPDKCDNCHGGYDLDVEPAFSWRGSMMAHAQRDPLYLACVAIANQDAPESGDLCIRCHSPEGWLGGRSTPTDGSALTTGDREGVHCDFCHKLVKPTQIGVNPFPDDEFYTSGTYAEDQAYLSNLLIVPPQSGNAGYIVDNSNSKRGPFVDAAARHQMLYSPYHSESDLCGICHDVSNPVYTRQADGSYAPNEFGSQAPDFKTGAMLPVERTYSEWKMSAFNTPEGVPSDVFGGNKANVSTCQDCHMRDVTGYGCNKKGVPLRNDLPLHDMTGGNTFIPDLIADLYPEEVNQSALQAGKQRATEMLQSAALMDLLVTEQTDGFLANVKVTNQTGHKLPSGYPEGRRIWINLKAFDVDGNLIYESGAYNTETADLNKEGAKIYEIKLGMSEVVAAAASADGQKTYTPGESFHFVLNDLVVKDNRIPPMGFTNENFNAIQSPVVDYTYDDGQHWDNTEYVLPAETFRVNARLLYQTVSKEYVTFLRDENRTNDAGQVLYFLWDAHGKSAPVVMNEVDFYNGAPPVKTITVGNATLTRHSEKGGKTYVMASVNVIDGDGAPVEGALVTGRYSGPTSNTVTGTTNADGLVDLASSSTKRVNGNWCLNITAIDKAGYEYTDAIQICEGSIKSASITSDIDPTSIETVSLFAYPNPAIDKATVKFSMVESSEVVIDLYSITGVKIKTLTQKVMPEGINEIDFDISDMAQGQYVISLTKAGKVETTILTVK